MPKISSKNGSADRAPTRSGTTTAAGIDEPLARKNSSDVVTYYLADQLGSIVQESSVAGTITLQSEHDPWGILT